VFADLDGEVVQVSVNTTTLKKGQKLAQLQNLELDFQISDALRKVQHAAERLFAVENKRTILAISPIAERPS